MVITLVRFGFGKSIPDIIGWKKKKKQQQHKTYIWSWFWVSPGCCFRLRFTWLIFEINWWKDLNRWNDQIIGSSLLLFSHSVGFLPGLVHMVEESSQKWVDEPHAQAPFVCFSPFAQGSHMDQAKFSIGRYSLKACIQRKNIWQSICKQSLGRHV